MKAPDKDERSTTFPLSDSQFEMLEDLKRTRGKGCEGSGVSMFSEKVRMDIVDVVDAVGVAGAVDTGNTLDTRIVLP
ncbi:hypothetical protein BELL_0185g00010 [Botrytis elliptica]|uniref:Uncharacterized protein n=1 Tax=Botrytis elliptica TaxID=278938 RepID=A0A4Z1JR29_9HELO|nr:hypothetical protein BELL_0185g00010 [Botrytis elliptica]